VKALLKTLVGALATPLAVAFVLALAALVCRFTGRRKLASGLLASTLAIAYLGSLTVIGDILMVPLETRYPPLSESALAHAQVTTIVVLGSSYSPRESLPVTATFDDEGLARIAEGVRLALRFPAARLIVSGGASQAERAPAQGYARFAREFGIPEQRLVVLDRARDTAQEASAIVALLGREKFILVTSAFHMPRAMVLMESAGASPVPAPTSQHTAGSVVVGGLSELVLPSSYGLRKTERALHEYLGLAAKALSVE
jgi:uncharacterized SAM-binding protein YcdF (DUF218 family)